MRATGVAALRAYHGHSVSGELTNPPGPVLFVANHGVGGIFDLNLVAAMAAFEAMHPHRPVAILTHQLAWSLQVGPLIEPFGAIRASSEEALAAFERGEHVLVLPGGDVDAFKDYWHRNDIVFGGRTGFAKIAVDAGVPIIPVVTAGAGETALVLSDGQTLARALRLDRLVRLKAVPISVSVPWGLSVGLAGLLPYFPLPARLATEVLPPMRPARREDVTLFATQVEAAMQSCLTELAARLRARPPAP